MSLVRDELRIELLTNGHFEIQDDDDAIDVDREEMLWLLTTGIPAALARQVPSDG